MRFLSFQRKRNNWVSWCNEFEQSPSHLSDEATIARQIARRCSLCKAVWRLLLTSKWSPLAGLDGLTTETSSRKTCYSHKTVLYCRHVFDIERDKLEWKVKGNLPGMEKSLDASGIAANGRGHLFVADGANRYIQMFSASDGQYLGRLMTHNDADEYPSEMRWCEKSSALVCSYRFNDKWYLKVLRVQFWSSKKLEERDF